LKTQYFTASSLDGFIADSDNSLNWLYQFADDSSEELNDFFAQAGAIVMGSTTYEWLLANEIKPGSDDAKPWPYSQPTWVFSSRQLPPIPDADIRFVSGDVRPVHEAMRAAAGEKNIWLTGGGDLVGQFYDHGLLDEIIVTVASVTLGSGAPLLPRKIAFPPLKLISVKQFGTSFAHLVYEVPKG
jgi:dihydrofolate reductase